MTVADEPEWRTVWYAFERTDDEFNAAFARMDQAFADRRYTNLGDMLHVFGIRLWLSRINVLARTRDEVVAECQAYIDDLYNADHLPMPAERVTEINLRFGGYDGLGIHDSDTPEYRDLFEYLRGKQRQANLDRRPNVARELIESMKKEPDQFFQKINVTADAASEWYNVPVFAGVEPATFVSAYLGLTPAGQRAVAIALKGRYEHDMLQRDLVDERDWVREVRRLLLQRASNASAIAKYRIEQNVNYALDPLFKSNCESSILDDDQKAYIENAGTDRA